MTIDEVRKRYAYCAQVPVGKTMLKMRYTEDCGFLLREVDRLAARLAAADALLSTLAADDATRIRHCRAIAAYFETYDATKEQP